MHAQSDSPRPCERKCQGECGRWLHHSRFRSFRHSTTSKIYFHTVCRACEQKEQNERKNADRPAAIIRGRAAVAAHKAGVSTEFFWIQMNYLALVPEMRAHMSDEGRCKNCGHAFLNERDIQIEHIQPPRHNHDWARLHARNLRLFCGSCNRTKSGKDFSIWLDEQEDTRLSNSNEPRPPDRNPQLDLFGETHASP